MEQEKPNHRIKIVALRNRPGLCGPAAAWFSGKWGIPEAEYRRSMEGMLQKSAAVPQWYVTLGGQGEILAGAGVIENDFHNRPDLCPNVCALFVEQAYRRRGLARALLRYIREDAARMGITTLYLVTEHTDFYEKCGWQHCAMCKDDDGLPLRVYKAETRA